MAQPGNFTPILLYASSTPGNVPLAANLTNSTTGSEIAINVADKNLFFKDSTNTVNTVPIRQSGTSSNGWLSSTDWNTFNNKQPAGTYVTSISIASSNGFTGTSSGGATPSLTLATSVTGILKGNGTAISAATSGTDYAPATSGSSILYGNGAGGFSNVTIGSGVSFSGGTLSATGSGGTVTSVAALTIGTTGTDLSSTVANGTTTPVITLNVPTASATNRGALSSTDWSTFNGKQAALVSGTNIKTVGGVSLLGSGDVGTIGTGYGGTGLTSFTNGGVVYASSTSALTTSTSLLFNSQVLGIGNTASSWTTAYRVLQMGLGASILGRTDDPGLEIGNNEYRDPSTGNRIYLATQPAAMYHMYSGAHSWFTAASGTAGNTITFTQQMTLTNSGALLVGNTTSVQGSIIEATSSSASTPALLARVNANSDESQWAFQTQKKTSTNTTAQVFVRFLINDGATPSGYITANGANAATFTSSSDARLKENIVDLPNQLSNILALRPVEFDYIDGSGRQIGFIAQEMQAVYADSVSEGTDGMLQIGGWSKTEARLVKAIQEQQDIIEQLKAKVGL